MKRISFCVAILATSVFAHANGDPVVRFSSVNRVANPEPLSISEIRIVHEQLNITHVDGYNCFDVTYRFRNESDKDFPEIHYGFPIDYLVADELETYQFRGDHYSESIAERGWNERLIRDISFTFNGGELPFHSSKESVREAGFEVETYGDECDSIPFDAINRRWFYTKFAMEPHAEATLTVRYKVYANSSVGLYSDDHAYSYYARRTDTESDFSLNVPFTSRYFADKFDILYDFTPARHFGNGRPYVIDVDIDLSNLNGPWVWGDDGNRCYVSHVERNIYFMAQDTKPIDMTVYFQSDRSESNVNRIIDRFRIPESEYALAIGADTVRMDFHNPVFVSDLACDMDTTGVRAISSIVTYADGSQKQYKYEPKEGKESVDTRIKSPVLLTITDMFHDGRAGSDYSADFISQDKGFGEDRFKVKSIRLSFDTQKSAKSVCRGIKVLNARFTNGGKTDTGQAEEAKSAPASLRRAYSLLLPAAVLIFAFFCYRLFRKRGRG